MAGDAEQTSAAVSRRAAIGVGFAAFLNDGWNGAERFDVIDDGRAAVEADDGREGRLDARIAAFAFKRFHQRGFFAAFVGARAGVNQQIVIEAAAKNIFAEVAALVSLLDGFFDQIENVTIFAANIDEAAIGSDGAAGDDHAFDQLVRIHFHQRAIFAGAGFGFVGVADDVFRFRAVLGHERPLHAGGEACAAASTQIGFLDFVDDRGRSHLFQRFFERLIAAVLEVHVDLAGILDAPHFADQRSFLRIARMKRAGNDRDWSRLLAGVELLDDLVERQWREIFVEIVIDLNRGCAGAGADTFDLFQREDAVVGDFLVADFQALFGSLENVVAAAQHAGDVGADLHVVLAHRLAMQHGVILERFLDLHGAKIEARGDFRDHFVADETEFVLRVHQHRDQRAALDRISVLQVFESCRKLW